MAVKRNKSENNIILYQDENGVTMVNVRFSNEDLWLAQLQIAEIYDTTQQNIDQHIKISMMMANWGQNQLTRNSC